MIPLLPIEEEVLAWIEEVWPQQPAPYSTPQSVFNAPLTLWHSPDHILYPALQESIRRLRARWPSDTLTHFAADVFFQPLLYSRIGESWKARVIDLVTRTWMYDIAQPPDIIRRVEEAVVLCFTIYPEALEKRLNHTPTLTAKKFLDVLDLVPDSPELFDLLERLVRGDTLVKKESDKVSLTYTPRDTRTLAYLSTVGQLERLNRAGRLPYDLFAAAVRYYPFLLSCITGILHQGEELRIRSWMVKNVPLEFFESVRAYADRLAEELAANITENINLLKQCHHLLESKWLLRAADLHVSEKLTTLEWEQNRRNYTSRPSVDSLVIHLAQADLMDIDSDDKRARLVDTLRTYPVSTLKALLPVAKHSRDVLLAALGWEDCALLVNQIVEVSEYQPSSATGYKHWDIANSSDPRCGLMDVIAAKRALELAGRSRMEEIFELLGKSNIGIPNTLTLFEALAGLNTAKIKKSVLKRNQRFIKAYGLLPLERGNDEVLERYLFLKQYAKEAKKFGPERQANERGAAAVAMGNLAQVAGFGDLERLEWQMEAHLAEEVAPVGRQLTVEEYTIELTLTADDPGLSISRAGKVLKSVPAGLRKNADYEAMKDAKNQLQEQFRRFRAVFERAMAAGDMFSPDDLNNLNRMPAARSLLSRLILRLDDLTTGLYLPEQAAVETLNGRVVPIDSPVLIAHPYHLFHSEELARWQQFVIHRRIIQPFKQAFRELYLLTPAEELTRLYSNRFAGHRVDGGVASRLFQSRGWEVVKSGYNPLPKRLFRQNGIEARFKFPDVGHYLSELVTTATGEISFHVYPNDDFFRDKAENIVPLDDVPPLIFSEVMRDADLIVSVGQRERGGIMLSNESYQRRGELVTTLLDDLGLPGVTVEGHFAYVQGKLASYRVHLGSAVIHIEPGNYLCIVPDRWGKTHTQMFLPFTDTDDGKMSEVISKIFLLLADDKIKDESILRQIKRESAQ